MQPLTGKTWTISAKVCLYKLSHMLIVTRSLATIPDSVKLPERSDGTDLVHMYVTYGIKKALG